MYKLHNFIIAQLDIKFLMYQQNVRKHNIYCFYFLYTSNNDIYFSENMGDETFVYNGYDGETVTISCQFSVSPSSVNLISVSIKSCQNYRRSVIQTFKTPSRYTYRIRSLKLRSTLIRRRMVRWYCDSQNSLIYNLKVLSCLSIPSSQSINLSYF